MKTRTLASAAVLCALTLSACGADATGVTARAPAQAPPSTVHLTARDLAAKQAFERVNWNNYRYPSVAPHCHKALEGSTLETGTVESYFMPNAKTNIAIVAATCNEVINVTPDAMFAFAPPPNGSDLPVLLSDLEPLPRGPLADAAPDDIFEYDETVPGLTIVRSVPSSAGTTPTSVVAKLEPVVSTKGCITTQPSYISARSFTVVGLTYQSLKVPDAKPTLLHLLSLSWKNGKIHKVLQRYLIAKFDTCS